jgi:cystathionine beta-lyase
MRYNFDEIVDRRNTNSIKWDFMEDFFGEKEAIPLFIADMDFKTSPAIIDALVKRAEHGVFGYTGGRDDYSSAVTGWFKRRRGWDVKPEWLVWSPHVMLSIYIATELFSQPGEKVIIMPPVYDNFILKTVASGRYLLENTVKFEAGRWQIDFDDLEAKARDPKARVLLLSNPHNPVGRSWTREELKRVGDICRENGVFVVSDEIHADLTLKGYKHVPWGTLGEEYVENCIISTSFSKTFNVSGLLMADIVIPNPHVRSRFRHFMVDRLNNIAQNPFGVEAVKAGYDGGSDEWLDALLDYIDGNMRYVHDFLKERIPQIKMTMPEATYLAWFDCRELGMSQKELTDFFIHELKLALYDGEIFGETGVGFMRMNVASPRSVIEEAMRRMEEGIRSRQ